jgi:hypothetical protein
MTRKTPAISILGQLPFSARNAARWRVQRALSDITDDFVHYSAEDCDPAASSAEEVRQLQGMANYHIQKDWSIDGSGVYGWAIMYHWAIAPSGRLYELNDPRYILWNTTYGNPLGVATVLMLGPHQQPTQAMLATLASHLQDNEQDTSMRIIRARTFGHGECGLIYGGGPDFGNDTPCPGAAMQWVRNYRLAPPAPVVPPESRFFPETGHYIGHGFRARWEALETIGLALNMVGYPITEEHQQTIGTWTGTVQDFQRARMEFHPENPAPYDVLFGLVNAELVAARAGAMVLGH